ncbi:MAG TPA: hypothetical protein VF546_04400 [Pyrinomonadaceae bacterium]|jgi:hypothetical protein
MNPQLTPTAETRRNPIVWPLVSLAAFLLVCACGVALSAAQSAQEGTAEERKFENMIPANVPVKVKIKNEPAFKDLDNDKWARDLEIEVENKSNKPIYHLLLSLTLPEVFTENNRRLTFPLRYGRADLIDLGVPLQPDDVPLQPGNAYTFRIPVQLQEGWQRFAARRQLPKSEPRKVQLKFLSLNFGDGTGFDTSDGAPADIHAPRTNGRGASHT